MGQEDSQNKTIQLNTKAAYQQALAQTREMAALYHEEQSRREELETLSQTLTAAFTSMPDSLVVLDSDFLVERVNPAFLSLLEINELDALGNSIFTLIRSETFQQELQSLKGKEFSHHAVEFIVDAPMRRTLLANIATLAGSSSSGLVVIFHDRSDHKRLEYQKSEFINIAAHELRTPLAAILGFAEIIKYNLNAKGESDEIESLNAIIEASVQLKEIVDELIQFAEVNESDPVQDGIQPFSVDAIVSDAINEVETLIKEKDITLTRLAHSGNLTMFATPSLVKMICNQLLLNAINFNHPGGKIHIDTARVEGRVIIRVADTGIGIPQTDLKLIFESFYQVQSHMTRNVGGLGLGLSIVRYALEQLGGEIKANSTLGEGSIFTVSLPERQPTLMPAQKLFFSA